MKLKENNIEEYLTNTHIENKLSAINHELELLALLLVSKDVEEFENPSKLLSNLENLMYTLDNFKTQFSENQKFIERNYNNLTYNSVYELEDTNSKSL